MSEIVSLIDRLEDEIHELRMHLWRLEWAGGKHQPCPPPPKRKTPVPRETGVENPS